MKANELRVGNLIASGSQYSDTSIISRVITIDTIETPYEKIYCRCDEEFEWYDEGDYCGIPLTEEWLVKFGLDKVDDEWFIKGFYFPLYLSKTGLVIRGLNASYGHVSYLKINHVHQLQNLYFVLTNTSLNIKEL